MLPIREILKDDNAVAGIITVVMVSLLSGAFILLYLYFCFMVYKAVTYGLSSLDLVDSIVLVLGVWFTISVIVGASWAWHRNKMLQRK